MIRAHIDYALMAVFNFSFYSAAMDGGIELLTGALPLVALPILAFLLWQH